MQAARGASLTGDQTDPAHPDPRRRLFAVFAAVALTAYAVDIVTKILAVELLSDRPDVQLVGDLLQLHLTRNPGAAFSTGTAYTEVFSVVAIVAVLVVLYLARRVGSAGWAFAFGLLLAGVGGNLTDRLVRSPGPLRGHVIDFFMLPHWPIFNVADICIDVAAGLILLQVYRGIHIDGTRVARDDDRGDRHPDGEAAEPEADA